MNTDFLKIAGYASKAPSGHNTQPWRFGSTDDGIVILPDFSVRLPVVDGDDRELFISLGCALENLVISARHFGYSADVTGYGTERIGVRLMQDGSVGDDPLFGLIERRQTNRGMYNGDKLADRVLGVFESLCREDRVKMYFTPVGSALADTLTEYIVKGNRVQMNDKAFKAELLSWMRFTAGQVKKTNDGLSYKVFGNPPLPPAIAKPIVRCFLKPDKQNKSDREKIRSSSHLVLFTTQDNTPGVWIGVGRTLQRFLLMATGEGVSCAFLNQPCEVRSLAVEMQDLLPINKEYPTLILRLGYADAMPYSPRKQLEELLV
ncbi:Acg family FMN-binding oxidoreductase [Butyricimonas synergistica]|uniref:Acg family FMN-binding oxidoreductase n=1 Tax=Butyricimonas synergistica TaxID=544644 RepID=UPI000379A7D5|nr:hypothetical protein [Butyricimonas synergistica]